MIFKLCHGVNLAFFRGNSATGIRRLMKRSLLSFDLENEGREGNHNTASAV